MKSTLVFICLLLGLASTSQLRADGDAGYKPESRTSTEIFTSKVVKVLSFQEGDAEYVAYMVTWKDHEVAATPLMVFKNDKRYNVGDTIRCQMMETPHRVSDTGKIRMIFSVLSDDAQRLEAIRAEIEARRQQRADVEAPATPKAP